MSTLIRTADWSAAVRSWRRAGSAGFCALGVAAALVAMPPAAMADPTLPAPPAEPAAPTEGAEPLVPDPQAAGPDLAAADAPASEPVVQAADPAQDLQAQAGTPTDGIPHLYSPDNLPPGTAGEPVGRPQGRNMAYLRELWHAIRTQDVTMSDALFLFAQRPLNPDASPPRGMAAGPQPPAPGDTPPGPPLPPEPALPAP